MDKKLGFRIKTLRMAKGLSKERVAYQIGVTLQKYIFIENGLVRITYDILSKVAKALNVKVDDITMILDESLANQIKNEDTYGSTKEIFDILDLFYANKRLYKKLHSPYQAAES